MDCTAVKPLMEALVSGSLPKQERSLAEQHISICEGCRLELELVRAIGSQEKPPAVGQEDWTIDRIFGPEGNTGAGVPGQAPGPYSGMPAAPREEANPPGAADSSFGAVALAGAGDATSIFPGMDSTPPGEPAPAPETTPGDEENRSQDAAAAKPAGETASWDFEPTDAKPNVKPPEESLFFAAEALTRRKNSEGKKSSNVRVILWGAGGIVGAALLAFSAWFVLHMGSSSGSSAAGPAGIHARPPTGETGQGAPEQAPDPGTTQPPANDDGGAPPDQGSPAPDMTSHEVPPAPASAPRLTTSSTAPQPLSLGSRATAAPQGATSHDPSVASNPALESRPTGAQEDHLPPEQPKPSPRTTVRASDQASPGETHGHAATSVIHTPRPAQHTPRPAQETPRQAQEAPDPTRESSSDETPATQGAPSDESSKPEPAVDSQSSAPVPKPGAAKTPAQAPPASGVASRRTPSSMWRTETPRPPEVEKPAETPSQTATIEASSPIERLHLATLAAEGRGDVDALRRLRSTWKSFMGKIIGPDRSRAKREYADCLWAIQSITGRRSDQKDTMAAYREYLLGAPAGGADSRSVSRLRQLEDAFAERR